MDKRTALEKLGKKSIRELSSKDFPAVFEMLPQLGEADAKEILDYVLSSSQGLADISKYLYETIRAEFAEKGKVSSAVNGGDRAIIDGLIKLLERDDLTYDERREIRNDLLNLSQRMHDTDEKERSYSEKMINLLKEHQTTIFGVGIGIIATAFYQWLQNQQNNRS